jgi:hypothetical protein
MRNGRTVTFDNITKVCFLYSFKLAFLKETGLGHISGINIVTLVTNSKGFNISSEVE